VNVYQSYSQHLITGIIQDMDSNKPVTRVSIRNIYTQEIVLTDEDGRFAIQVDKGQLIECTHIRYEMLRLRINADSNTKYYNLVMRKVSRRIPDINIVNKDANTYSRDSARLVEEYKIVLNKPLLKDMNFGVAALEMLSKKRRQEMAFAKHFTEFEREKFIDSRFNKRLVKRWTGLEDEAAIEFMRKYRPSYEFMRKATDYQYYTYLKKCLTEFCSACVFKVM
jgi:hypothetical protein